MVAVFKETVDGTQTDSNFIQAFLCFNTTSPKCK